VNHIYNCRIDYIIFYPIVVPDACKKLLSQLPGVKTVEVTAKYPVVEGTAKVIYLFIESQSCNVSVDYTSGEVPVTVHMEAFNPCIPLDSKNSGLPVIVFTFTVSNTSPSTANVCVACAVDHAAIVYM